MSETKPKPKLRGRADPNRDMSKSGWRKEVTYKYVEMTEDEKAIICTEIDYYAKDEAFQCHGCGTNQFVWLIPDRQGVMKACLYCETVEGPITKTLGIQRAKYEVDLDTALAILEGYGNSERDRFYQALVKKFSKETLVDFRKLRERPKH